MTRAHLHLIAIGSLIVCTVGGAIAVWLFFGMLGAGVPFAPPYTREEQRGNLILGGTLGAVPGLIVMLILYRLLRYRVKT